ncbi:MAG: hypothetical protein IJZ29_05165 [Clostridia bacterium]|nr:hypothetical protein [Clostridia bacterium]
MNGNSSLRKMALAAKKRLNGASTEKEKRVKKQVSSFAVYKNLYKNDFQVITLKNNDDALYEKVKALLDINFDSPNILKSLVDDNVYAKLEEDKKMEYMLKLADKYNQLKKRYIQENSNNLAM